MRVDGVDDAGRGPIIGPMTIAGVLLNEEDLPQLMSLGVKDSKLLSPRKRSNLAEEIKEIALKHHTVFVPPAEIDIVVNRGRRLYRLNRLEAQKMAEVIRLLHPEVAYVDASDVLADRFGIHITENLPFKVKIISEHKADLNYPIVSAASILAKVERDKAISALQEKHGDLGTGYASDRKTITFLEECIKQNGCYPDFVRKSWKPAKKLKIAAKTKQRKLR
jgi:ribonuclease HII